MTALVAIGIGALGGIGALTRFLFSRELDARTVGDFPVGTLAVNLSGALVLGVLAGVALHGDALRLAGTGFLGAYTTFSTWMFDTRALAAQGRRRAATINVVVSLAGGMVAIWLGRELGRLF